MQSVAAHTVLLQPVQWCCTDIAASMGVFQPCRVGLGCAGALQPHVGVLQPPPQGSAPHLMPLPMPAGASLPRADMEQLK